MVRIYEPPTSVNFFDYDIYTTPFFRGQVGPSTKKGVRENILLASFLICPHIDASSLYKPQNSNLKRLK